MQKGCIITVMRCGVCKKRRKTCVPCLSEPEAMKLLGVISWARETLRRQRVRGVDTTTVQCFMVKLQLSRRSLRCAVVASSLDGRVVV